MQLESLRRHFTSLLALFIVAQVVVLVLLYTRTKHFVALRSELRHVDDLRGELIALRTALADAETGQRGFVITGREEFLQPYRAAVLTFAPRLDRLRVLFGEQKAVQQRFDALSSLLLRTQSDLTRLVEVRRRDGFEAAQKSMLDGAQREGMEQLRTLTLEIDEEVQRRSQSEGQDQLQAAARLLNLAFLALCAGLLVTAGLGVFVLTRLKRLSATQSKRLLDLARELRTAAKTAGRDAANLATLSKGDTTRKDEGQATLEVITRMAKELSTVAMEITSSVRVLCEDPAGTRLPNEQEMDRIVSLAGRVAQSALSIELTTAEQLRLLDTTARFGAQLEQSVKNIEQVAQRSKQAAKELVNLLPAMPRKPIKKRGSSPQVAPDQSDPGISSSAN